MGLPPAQEPALERRQALDGAGRPALVAARALACDASAFGRARSRDRPRRSRVPRLGPGAGRHRSAGRPDAARDAPAPDPVARPARRAPDRRGLPAECVQRPVSTCRPKRPRPELQLLGRGCAEIRSPRADNPEEGRRRNPAPGARLRPACLGSRPLPRRTATAGRTYRRWRSISCGSRRVCRLPSGRRSRRPPATGLEALSSRWRCPGTTTWSRRAEPSVARARSTFRSRTRRRLLVRRGLPRESPGTSGRPA